MRSSIIFIFATLFNLSNSIHAAESFNFSGKIKCELSATFIVFDFENKIAVRNNYSYSKFKLSNYETKKNKYKKTIHSFSWYNMKDNFLGYWIISNDSKSIEEIKFDTDGEIFSINRKCSLFKNNKIGELVWE